MLLLTPTSLKMRQRKSRWNPGVWPHIRAWASGPRDAVSQCPHPVLVARTTIQLAKEGERDPQRLSEGVIRLYRKPAI
jgi:hypothetical protein